MRELMEQIGNHLVAVEWPPLGPDPKCFSAMCCARTRRCSEPVDGSRAAGCTVLAQSGRSLVTFPRSRSGHRDTPQYGVCAGIRPSLTIATPTLGRSRTGARKPVAAMTSSLSSSSTRPRSSRSQRCGIRPRAAPRARSPRRRHSPGPAADVLGVGREVPHAQRREGEHGGVHRRGEPSTIRRAQGRTLCELNPEFRLPTMKTLLP